MTLVDWDPDAETKVVAAMLYPYTHLPESDIAERVRARMTVRGAHRGGPHLRRGPRQPPPPAGTGPGAHAATAST